MQKFLLGVLLGWLGGALMIGGQVAGSRVRAQPPDPLGVFAAPLRHSASEPGCEVRPFLGILPGQTSLAEAEALLKIHPLTRHVESRRTDNDLRWRDGQWNIVLRADHHGLVVRIWYTLPAAKVTFGDLVAGVGAPTAVQFFLHDAKGYMSWYFGGCVVATTWLKEPVFSPHLAVTHIEIGAMPIEIPFPNMYNAIPRTRYTIPQWLGFRWVGGYLRHPGCQQGGYPFAVRACDPQSS